MNRNYQKELDKLLERLDGEKTRPSLFLHACCAPCSSYVLEYLSKWFDITVFYYNPNIFPSEEYKKRVCELKRLISEMPACSCVRFEEGPYEPERFFEMAKGLEDLPEGGERCFRCYRLRLAQTARRAAEGGYDYFTTTLSISPHKNAAVLGEIAGEEGRIWNVNPLPSDFKKKNGFKRSTQLSAEYGLYRQDYCGCVFSKREAQARHAAKGGT
ncbi:MAG: epoxyqueuosine reductase QueH [Blautia sp.]|nr:epoxyqueuosine reductase QueH [Blautia sp.]